MEAQQSFVSLSRLPSSAWAARPLASGAPFSVIGRRCFSGVEVGCPSSGGQRTGGGGSSRPLAELVTGSNSQLTVSRVGSIGSGSSSQTARSAAIATCGSTSNTGLAVVNLCRASVHAHGRRTKDTSAKVGLTETAKSESLSRQSRASFAVGVESRLARWSRKGWSAKRAATSAPNHSVKGTSCAEAQAAPYLERYA